MLANALFSAELVSKEAAESALESYVEVSQKPQGWGGGGEGLDGRGGGGRCMKRGSTTLTPYI
jgi:hypothetical protein